MSATSAEEQKALGNTAFAAKDYETALEHYSRAIKLDPSNHVYYSNRSASHGSLGNWTEALKDAKECLRLNPEFVKGYYRVATAQLELGEYESAIATVKQGLAQDPNNEALLKLLKQAKQYAKKQKTTSTVMDASVSQELLDLQQAHRMTSREHSLVQTSIAHAQRSARAHQVTKSELESLSNNGKTYRSVGKAFLLSSREEITEYLDKSMETETKREADLKHKLDYLERRLKSQQQNIQELSKSTTTTTAG